MLVGGRLFFLESAGTRTGSEKEEEDCLKSKDLQEEEEEEGGKEGEREAEAGCFDKSSEAVVRVCNAEAPEKRSVGSGAPVAVTVEASPNDSKSIGGGGGDGVGGDGGGCGPLGSDQELSPVASLYQYS